MALLTSAQRALAVAGLILAALSVGAVSASGALAASWHIQGKATTAGKEITTTYVHRVTFENPSRGVKIQCSMPNHGPGEIWNGTNLEVPFKFEECIVTNLAGTIEYPDCKNAEPFGPVNDPTGDVKYEGTGDSISPSTSVIVYVPSPNCRVLAAETEVHLPSALSLTWGPEAVLLEMHGSGAGKWGANPMTMKTSHKFLIVEEGPPWGWY